MDTFCHKVVLPKSKHFISDYDITKDNATFLFNDQCCVPNNLFNTLNAVKSGSKTSIALCCLHNQSWVKYHRKPFDRLSTVITFNLIHIIVTKDRK